LAVLGLVIERPSYGYELSRRLGERLGELLPVSRSHVYGALDALQRGGLIEPLPPAADAPRQPKVHYRATPEGRRAFADWVLAELEDHAHRARLLGTVAALDGDCDAVTALVADYERAWARFAPTEDRTAAGAGPDGA
jgi:DNA-binding PadR family transcriptional regulator